MAWRPPHPSVQRQGCRTQKLNFSLRFDQNVEYRRPAVAYPLRDFHKICRFCTPFQDALSIKIRLNFLEGLWSSGGFKLMVSGYPQISAPLAAKLCIKPPQVLEAQERAGGPLSPCLVWWGWISPDAGVAKNVECFVCLSVCPSRF